LRAAATFWRVWTRAGVFPRRGGLIVRALRLCDEPHQLIDA
jgi:hypothetical protein